jgi:class 3 adenylate cyclase
MVFFNYPLEVQQHELHAIRLALAAQERFAELAQVWRKLGIQLGLGIGIEAGYATLGRIGFEGRYDYGALGPVTNLASRLSTAAEPVKSWSDNASSELWKRQSTRLRSANSSCGASAGTSPRTRFEVFGLLDSASNSHQRTYRSGTRSLMPVHIPLL